MGESRYDAMILQKCQRVAEARPKAGGSRVAGIKSVQKTMQYILCTKNTDYS